MEFFKVALEADFLLFVLGMVWLDLAGYIQAKIATCNPKTFGFVVAILLYAMINYLVP